MSDERIEELGLPRRTFLKKAAVAFATPMVASFALEGVAEACQHQPNQAGPNQTGPNQTAPNQTAPNQTAPNQTMATDDDDDDDDDD
jgi:hypothetical protein